MARDTMNIALPEAMKAFVLRQVSQGGYSTASEYVRELIRADQEHKAERRLEVLLLEGLDSGKSTPMTKQDWKAIRAKVAARSKARRRK